MTARFRPYRGRVAVPAVERPRAVGLDRLAPYIVVALTTIGGILRVFALGSKGLWLDEAFSVWLGNQSLPELYAWLLRVDQHPPLYYTLLHLWIRAFGDTAFSVRLLSALFGTLTIPVMFLLGRRLLGATGGLVAAAILTVAPFHVRFAQETRMYALLTLNATLALFFLARLLTDPRAATDPLGAQLARWFGLWRAARRAGAGRASEADIEAESLGYAKRSRADSGQASRPFADDEKLPLSSAATDLSWLGLIFFTVAAMLSHNTAVLFPFSTNLFVLGFILWRRRAGTPSKAVSAPCPAQLAPPSLRNWLISQAAVLLLWSPWLAAFVIQATGVYREFWISKPTLMTVALAVGNFFSAHLPARATLIGAVGAVFAVLLIIGVFHLRRSPALLALLATLFAAPFVGELLVSIKRPIFYDRTLIYTTIPLYLTLAAGVLQLRFRPYMLAALAAIVAINGVSLHSYYTHFEKEQWREAAAYVADEVQKDDLLIFNATWVQIPFDFYFRDANHPVEERGAPVDLFDRGILEPKMAQSDVPRLQELIRGRERVWLIYSHNWYTDPQSIIPNVLGAELKLLEQRPFYGLDVRLYGGS